MAPLVLHNTCPESAAVKPISFKYHVTFKRLEKSYANFLTSLNGKLCGFKRPACCQHMHFILQVLFS